MKPRGSSTRWTAPTASFSRKAAASSRKTPTIPLLYLAFRFSFGRRFFWRFRLPGRRFQMAETSPASTGETITLKRYPRNPRPEAPTTKRGPTGPPAAGWVVVGKPGRGPAGPLQGEPSTRRWSCGDNATICPAGKTRIVYPVDDSAMSFFSERRFYISSHHHHRERVVECVTSGNF